MVTPEWPGETSGYELAIGSLLRVLRQEWAKVDLCSFSPRPMPSAGGGLSSLPARMTRPATRFLLSLPGSRPAVAWRAGRAAKTLRGWVRSRGGASVWNAVLLEDLPAAEAWRRAGLHHTRVHLRLHNILADAFEGMEDAGRWWRRAAWRLERRRIADWERDVLSTFSTDVSTLSDADSARLVELYGVSGSVLPLAITTDRYSNLPGGSSDTLVCVGSADERKGAGLHSFVRQVWPHIRARHPSARLLLGGRGTERFDDPGTGIDGLGFVDDDRLVLSKGRIFVNPQTMGSGVKLKSLVAMAAGRCLLTYPEGVRGVPGQARADYVLADSPRDMVERASELIDDRCEVERLASRGRRLVEEQFSDEKVRQALPDALRPVPKVSS